MDGKITEDQFFDQMEIDKNELEDVLAEMDARTHPTRILENQNH